MAPLAIRLVTTLQIDGGAVVLVALAVAAGAFVVRFGIVPLVRLATGALRQRDLVASAADVERRRIARVETGRFSTNLRSIGPTHRPDWRVSYAIRLPERYPWGIEFTVFDPPRRLAADIWREGERARGNTSYLLEPVRTLYPRSKSSS